MREKYPGWYTKSATEVAALWENAIFVPDANVLLHCLRHPAVVREELLRLFSVLRASLWIPYQVGLEFHRNRLDVELGAQDAYDSLVRDQEANIERACERLRQLRAHPTIDVQKELAALNIFVADFKARMREAQNSHPTDDIDTAVTRLTELLDNRVGDRWTLQQFAAIKKEGEERYSKKIPPGYKDAKKDAGEFDKFGDLIIWKDMIAKAKLEGRPIIFISDDVKEDWWWIHKGRKQGPRPELIEEFRRESGQDFHIYEFSQFLRFAAARHPEMQGKVEKVEESLLADIEAKRRLDDQAEGDATRLREIEDERDQVISALSGAPGGIAGRTAIDRTALRLRLRELNEEIELISDQGGIHTSNLSDAESYEHG
ncbi:PIN-like domain-containing protein [Kordiimonas aestuarii]|uniref:PIN-like domain-containing protein n=1 Tax=Kordiimonas aestuarii TaxID=1005925 RepID=UPI0021D35C9D|nr:PIN-like domain-containing protein [Kordiimonas aestuarii]